MPIRPALATAQLTDLLRTRWDVVGDLTPLPGEWDQNLRVASQGVPTHVLKVSPAGVDGSLLAAQAVAMKRVVDAGLPGPRLVHQTQLAGHHIRLLSWVTGSPLAEVEQTPALRQALGRHLGRMSAALDGLELAAAHRHLAWDLVVGADEVAARWSMLDPAVAPMVEAALKVAQDTALPLLPGLRRSVLHNDANDHNVLVGRDDSGALAIAGVIDFGDLVYSATVAELAIAAAYAAMDQNHPLDAIADLVRGFHAVFALSADELSALWGLVLLRLCVSAAMAAEQAQLHPEDGYVQVSQAPLRRTLPRMLEIPPELARQVFIGATLRRSGPAIGPRARVAASRRRTPNVRLSYRKPLHLVRGWMQHLWDADGRRYLDAYNNVPHVGHSHPRVVQAIASQAAVLNTNSRYLTDVWATYTTRLLATFPYDLDCCFLLSSASEANELAVRLARVATGHRDMVVLEHAYHGHTNTLIDLSPYKHGGPGGKGAPPWVHVAPIPLPGPSLPQQLVAFEAVVRGTDGLAGLLHETCPSVGGQRFLPNGWLRGAYRRVRARGGLCIADEVQTGLGRLGSRFWAFDEHGVEPDIVVLGKPLGNGFPLAAVVTRRAIAAAFDNGMEFFSTFGGNTVACAAGLAVLDVVEEEGLQQHAAEVGDFLLAGLRSIEHPAIVEVRGSGLFLGVELRDPETGDPATELADQLCNGLRERGILIGTDGPHHEVLKIRPPMPFDRTDAQWLVDELGAQLGKASGR